MAEQKYIDADKVIKLLRKDLICKYPSSFSFGLWAAADEIAKMDGEDVRPVKRGHWVYEEPNSANKFKGAYWCDQCHQPEFYRRNYCPNCGADMRPKEDADA